MKIYLPAIVSLTALMSTPAFSAASNEELLREIRALKAENAALRAKAHPHKIKLIENSNTATQNSIPANLKNDDVIPSIPAWTGLYAGLSAGGNIGTNNNGVVSNYWNSTNWTASDYSVTPAQYSQGVFPGGAITNAPFMIQSGFIGGGQFGYNYRLNTNFVVGVEADIQGTTSKGSSKSIGNFGGSSSGVDRLNLASTLTVNQTGYLINSLSAGTDWIGTARARVGFLVTPSLLIYGTGGLAYGQAWANVTMNAASANAYSWNTPGTNAGTLPSTPVQGYISSSKSNSLLVGYSAGGGAEWLFNDNWSVKAEAIYWNLGNMSVSNSSAVGSAWSPIGSPVPSFGAGSTYQMYAGPRAMVGQSKFNYQGIIARAGVNYHFNFASAPVVAKF